MKREIELAKDKVTIAKKAYYNSLDTEQEDAAFNAVRIARKKLRSLQKQYINFMISQ